MREKGQPKSQIELPIPTTELSVLFTRRPGRSPDLPTAELHLQRVFGCAAYP